MRVLITSGGTTEYIDDVRVLTNISTGKLGAEIANWFLSAGHEVVFVYGRGSKLPASFWFSENTKQLITIEVKDTADLMDVMRERVPKAHAVIHAMAVSDFTFNRENPVKLKSSDADGFIEYMRANIKKTPKVISHIKEWNPDVYLVGFKFEVGIPHKELVQLGYDSLEKNGCEIVVVNDKEEMIRKNSHVAYIITNEGEFYVNGKEAIAKELLRQVTEQNSWRFDERFKHLTSE